MGERVCVVGQNGSYSAGVAMSTGEGGGGTTAGTGARVRVMRIEDLEAEYGTFQAINVFPCLGRKLVK